MTDFSSSTGSAKHPAEMSNAELSIALDNYVRWTVLEPSTQDLLNSASQRLRDVAQGQNGCGGPVAWQYREKMPNGAWGIWRHCDIVREDPTLEYRALYLGAAQAGREVSDERALDLARRILDGQFTTEDAACEIMIYATDCIEQEKGYLRLAYSAGNCGAWQLIKTAPKDETRILLYQRGRGSFEGWWKLDWPLGEYWMDDADSEPEPTHWQPLLPAPSVPSTSRGTEA